MIEINEAFSLIYKQLDEFCNLNNMKFRFNKDTMQSRQLPLEVNGKDYYMYMDGESGTAIVHYNSETKKIRLLASADQNAKPDECKQLSLWLLDANVHDEKDVKSVANDFSDTMDKTFAKAKSRDISEIKLPHSISKNQAKSGVASYDAQTLANRFVMIYPEYKDDLKQNLLDYGEFLAVDFAEKYIVPKMLEVLNDGTEQEQKKLFMMFNDIYEDGLNEVQDLIAVVIMSRMDNNEKYLEIADRYMSDYMNPTIHYMNKIMASPKGEKYREKMKNPPAYKPKKQKQSMMMKLMGGGQQGLNGGRQN
jgi:hypothetical protein